MRSTTLGGVFLTRVVLVVGAFEIAEGAHLMRIPVQGNGRVIAEKCRSVGQNVHA